MKNTAIDLLYHTVQKYPDKISLVDRQKVLSFQELFYWASGLAATLRKDNEINRPVLIYLPKGVQAIVSFAGVLMSGNFYVPLDVKSPQKRQKAIVENVKPYRIIGTRNLKKDLAALSIEKDKIIFVEDFDTNPKGSPIESLVAEHRKTTDRIIDTDPIYVMYTSGSTGIPKGVVIPHRGVIDYIEWAISCLKVDESEVIGNQAPLYFDNSTLDIYLCWATGAELHLIPEDVFIFPVKVLEYLEKYSISFIFFVPSVLVNMARMKTLSTSRLPSLKKIVFAGEVMPTKHLSYWQDHLPDRMFVNLYGPTEITVDCTYFIVDRKYSPDEKLPIGFPCHNTGILILNENNTAADTNELGELCVRGSSLALGYWNDEEKTKEVFAQNPLQHHYFDRIYRTGDIVYKNERDEIIFVGRKDSQVKYMGHRIELGEIEASAITIPQIDNCCVLYNDKKQEITFFYEGEKEMSVAELCNLLSQSLPKYMVPKKFHYFKKLPITANQKIDRTALKNEIL
jgi:D-alanine--poly(phosphoribitol) ligase subunit 1